MGAVEGTVDAVNRLTARWAQTVDGGTVFSAVGVWPLLAFLADGAAGAARAELADAVGMPADQAPGAARELLVLLGAVPGLATALGLWTRRELDVREEWRAGLPADTHGVLDDDLATARKALDAWAAERTGGLVERMPVTLTDDVLLVLAGASALRTEWLRPFEEKRLTVRDGPWRGRPLLGLGRRGIRLDRVGVAGTPDGRVTELKVPGAAGIDVHLLLGEERMRPGQVLGAGVDILGRRFAVVPGSRLPYGEAGPGLRVAQEPCTTPQPPVLDVTTVAYGMTAEHDLLALHGLFGLTTAQDTRQGHFPGISGTPLAVGAARQSARAEFGALGFRAASVTAVLPVPSGLPDHRHLTTVVTARFDRPFGFLAVHRDSRLVLTSGWVTDPTPYGSG